MIWAYHVYSYVGISMLHNLGNHTLPFKDKLFLHIWDMNRNMKLHIEDLCMKNNKCLDESCIVVSNWF